MDKPRPFNMKPIFIDERKERIEKPALLRGAFSTRRSSRQPTVSITMLLSMLVILIVIATIIIFV